MGVFRNLRSLFMPDVRYVYYGDYGVTVANMDAAMLYKTQPNLRAAVSFLADNASQVPLKVHARKSDDDRPRVMDSPAALLLQHPNPDMTPFEFKRWLYSDLFLYERCLVLVIPSVTSDSGWELRPIPSPWIMSYIGTNPFTPEFVDVASPGNAPIRIPADKFILFHGYDPTDPMRQCSRIAALKETLHEQVESNRFRRQMWHRGGRFNAYVTRPKDVEPWSPEGFERFKQTWKASWAGDNAGEGGGMPILEDGMDIKTVQFNSKDAQWAESVKLSREDVAGVYHFNPALLWPGTGQTYASAKDNARALYNDCLAPTIMQVTDRLNMALLPMIGEPSEDYVAYDFTIKTEGTFEEKIAALQSAVGAPFLTRDEARAHLNLPAIGANELIVPLNVIEGGLASNHDTDPTIERYNSAIVEVKSEQLKSRGNPKDADAREIEKALRKFFQRQSKSVLPKIGAKSDDFPSWWNAEKWDRELAEDLMPIFMAQVTRKGNAAMVDLGKEPDFDSQRTEAYIKKMAQGKAQAINNVTFRELEEALNDEIGEDAEGATPQGVFEKAEDSRAERAGISFATAVAGFATLEACKQIGGSRKAYKTWIVTSGNPRAEHAAMDGETVPFDDLFSNGAKYPGDQVLTPEESCNCKCQVEITLL